MDLSMHPAPTQPTVRIKMTRGEIVGTTWREAGDSAEVPEDVAVRLVHEGVASLGQGVKLTPDGSARLAKLARENPRKPAPPPVPAVKVRNAGPVEVMFGLWGTIAPGATVSMPEDAAAIGIFKGYVQLAPGESFSKRGQAYFDKVCRVETAEY